MTNMLTTHEAATRLRVRPRTVIHWIRGARLTGRRVGNKWLVPEADVESLLAGPAGQPPPAMNEGAPRDAKGHTVAFAMETR